MTAKDFYRILGRVRGMTWVLRNMPVEKFGKPNFLTFIEGERHSFRYSPLSAVASAVKREFVYHPREALAILRLHSQTAQRIEAAIYQDAGYSPVVRQKLLKACRLL